jgi:Fe-Mn family superoxide dismutase
MFVLPNLPYDYSALEPIMDTETMRIHHDMHHATYVKNLNEALSSYPDLLNLDVNTLLFSIDRVPAEIQMKVKNNAGGVANHSFFWNCMCNPDNSVVPINGKLFDAITSSFGSMKLFQDQFSAAALGHFGSGWAWLVVDSGKLVVMDTLNQDTPISTGKTPLLCIDVWEHAYYLKYKNKRLDYITNWWNVVNWREVERIYDGL